MEKRKIKKLLPIFSIMLGFGLAALLFFPSNKKYQKTICKEKEDILNSEVAEVVAKNNSNINFKDTREYYYFLIDNFIDFDEAVLDVCLYNNKLCNILTDKRIYSYLKQHYRKGLKALVEHESWGFKFKRGLYDKYDYCHFMINIRYWNYTELRKLGLNIKSNEELLKNDVLCIKAALRIWINNVAAYIYIKRKFPKNLAEYLSLYHYPWGIRQYYVKRVRKFIKY